MPRFEIAYLSAEGFAGPFEGIVGSDAKLAVGKIAVEDSVYGDLDGRLRRLQAGLELI